MNSWINNKSLHRFRGEKHNVFTKDVYKITLSVKMIKEYDQ